MLMFSPGDIASGANAAYHDLYILTGDGELCKQAAVQHTHFSHVLLVYDV
jgi:hypothetical protein